MPYHSPAHIPAERLWLAAINDEVMFSEIEFDHIKNCKVCFLAWKRFIERNEAEKHKNGPN